MAPILETVFNNVVNTNTSRQPTNRNLEIPSKNRKPNNSRRVQTQKPAEH